MNTQKPSIITSLTDEYDYFLDEAHGSIDIGCCNFSASRVLKELDPIAYRMGLLDYADAMLEEGIITQEIIDEI